MNLASKEVSGPHHAIRKCSSARQSANQLHFNLVQQYTSNKGFAEDLTEGKFSFPVVHGIHADPSNRQIISTSLLLFITAASHFLSYRTAHPCTCIIALLPTYFPRRPPKTPHHADAQDPHDTIPAETHKVFRIYPLRPHQARGTNPSRDQAPWREPQAGEDYGSTARRRGPCRIRRGGA